MSEINIQSELHTLRERCEKQSALLGSYRKTITSLRAEATYTNEMLERCNRENYNLRLEVGR